MGGLVEGSEGCTGDTEGTVGLMIWKRSRRFCAPQHWEALPAQVRLQIASRARMGGNPNPLPQRQVVPRSIPAYLKAEQNAVQVCQVQDGEVNEGPDRSWLATFATPPSRLVGRFGLMLKK